MRIAALYDIHGNLPALDAVLQDLRQERIDLLVIGGDVLPGPLPVESLDRLTELEIPVQFIQGNGDREVLAAMQGKPLSNLPNHALEAIRWTAKRLSQSAQGTAARRHSIKQLACSSGGAFDTRPVVREFLGYEELLAAWPPTLRVPIDESTGALFCHATPRNDTDIFTRLTPETRLLPLFESVDTALVVCGHTHMQFDRTIGTTRVLNAGSVGMPFSPPGAYWLSFYPEPQLRHTPYDLHAAARRISATTYPQAEEFASRNILSPPSEAEMLELFTRPETPASPKAGVPSGN